MLTKKEKLILKKSKKEIFIFVNIKYSLNTSVQGTIMIFFIGAILLFIDKSLFSADIIILFIMAVLVYFAMGLYLFKSVTLFLKLTLIYLRISVNKLFVPAFRK